MPGRLLLFAAVLAVTALTGCSPSAKLIGKWEADFEQAKAEVAGSGNPLAAMAAGMMELLKVEIEFKADGTMTMSGSVMGQSNISSGKWRYVKSEGNDLVLMVRPTGDAPEKELRITFRDNDHFEMQPPGAPAGGDRKLPFKRVKPG